MAESERYISRAPFKAILAVCKLTYGNGDMLFYSYTDPRGRTLRVPAVFKDLPDAVAALNGTLYTGVNITDPTYNAAQYGVSLEMLVENYTLPSAVTLPSGIPLTLTTASEYAEAYPYRGATTTVSRIARGAGVDGSMFTVNDSLELRGITLDGVKSSYTAAADGGIVRVNSGVTFVSDGKYLTGDNEREKDGFIHWIGGFDVLFTKMDSFGKPLPGAIFTLYTDAACTQVYRRGTADVAATSADGTAAYQTSSRKTLDKGVVLFEKLPAGVYYMKETQSPTGYTNKLPNDSGTLVENRYVILLGSAKISEWDTTYTTIDADAQSKRYAADDRFKDFGVKESNYAIFLLNSSNIPVATPDIAKYGVLNLSTAERKVVLRKVSESAFAPLSGVKFKIERIDGTLVEGTDINGATTTTFTSGASGVYFIGKLPYGEYTLHEVEKDGSTVDISFTLTVKDDTATGSRDGVAIKAKTTP